MSRIGKQPVSIPDKVKVSVNGETVLVEGPKGKVQKTFAPAVKVTVAEKDKKVTFAPTDDTRFAKAMYGTARSVVAGMVKGVTDGYVKDLEIQGVGFKATLKGKQLDLALGYSHPILMDIPDGIKVTVTDGTKLKVEGADKQLVGKITAEIRGYYPPEPYKGKGVRIVGERVRRKEGKTVA
jgi:large subunit ribosomal protein L6